MVHEKTLLRHRSKFAASSRRDDQNKVCLPHLPCSFRNRYVDSAKGYIYSSLLGVNNLNQLTECTKVLPRAIKSFTNPDQFYVDQSLSGDFLQLHVSLRNAVNLKSNLLGGWLGLRACTFQDSGGFHYMIKGL